MWRPINVFIYGYTKEIEIANALNFCTIDL